MDKRTWNSHDDPLLKEIDYFLEQNTGILPHQKVSCKSLKNWADKL